MTWTDDHTSGQVSKRSSRKAALRLLLAAAAAVGFDGLTKAWAERALAVGDSVPVVGDVFRLTLGYNTGVAFGLFALGGPWLLIVTSAIILSLTCWLLHALRIGITPFGMSPLGLILGGAVANFADRWVDGRVTDFLDLGVGAVRWPAFNLAGGFIVVGIAVLLLSTLFKQPSTTTQHDADRLSAGIGGIRVSARKRWPTAPKGEGITES